MLSHRAQKSLNWLAKEIPSVPVWPQDVLAMNSAENWLCRPDLVPLMKKAIVDNLEASHLSYSKDLGGPPDLLENASSFFNRFFNPRSPVLPSHIVCGAGAGSILDSLDFSLSELDEGMLINAPCWEGFGIASNLRNDDRLIPVTIPVGLSSPEQLIELYLKAMEAATCRVRSIIICNPMNPSGHIYPTSWLEAILQFCEEQDIQYIADEIYGMSAWESQQKKAPKPFSEKGPVVFESPETKFTSVLSLDMKRIGVNPARVHVVYALSKDLGSSGLRLVRTSPHAHWFFTNLLQGFLVTQKNPELRNAMAILNRYRVSNATSVIASSLFSDLLVLEHILVRNRMLLRSAAELVGDFLSFHRFAFYRPVAGVFIWTRLGGETATEASDAELMEGFASAKVSVASGVPFHSRDRGWFRITFALPREQLLEGLRRIERAMALEHTWRPSNDMEVVGVVSAQRTKPKVAGCMVM
ncbi:aminotransferase [Fusarium napiforme]|uniref:Aminotransferase n=1 Tax=Fusarium napiforme TaxID=42672 RepID=A0A8H5I9J6_9HYPO|nr:aminotransferase [Fusarium napiforme]